MTTCVTTKPGLRMRQQTKSKEQILQAAEELFIVRRHIKWGNCHVNTGPLAALDTFRSCYA